MKKPVLLTLLALGGLLLLVQAASATNPRPAPRPGVPPLVPTTMPEPVVSAD